MGMSLLREIGRQESNPGKPGLNWERALGHGLRRGRLLQPGKNEEADYSVSTFQYSVTFLNTPVV